MLAQLQDMGPASVDEIQAIVSMTEPQLKEYVALWEKKYAAARDQATGELKGLRADADEEIAGLKTDFIKEFADMPDVMENMGVNTVKGLIDGIKKSETGAIAAIRDLIRATIEAAKMEAGIMSPSKKFRDLIGLNIGRGVEEGIDVSMGEAAATMRSRISDLAAASRAAFQSATPLSAASGAQASPRIEPMINMGTMPAPQIIVKMEPSADIRGFFDYINVNVKRVEYLKGGSPA